MPVKANAEETGIISGQNDEKAAEGDSAALITGTCGENATWKLDFDTGKLTISGTGAMDDFNLGYQPWNELDPSFLIIKTYGSYFLLNCTYIL
jgi:hypothetical protein